MCNIWQHPTASTEELPPTFYERVPDGLGRLNITGGEPFIRDDIEDIVEVLAPKAKVVEISTNGFFTERVLSVAHRFPQCMFRVSLEGLPALNDELRGTRDGFDHALRTMLGLIESPAKDIGFSVVISDKNADDLSTLYKLCAALGIEFGNSVMHNSWYFHKSDNAVGDVSKAVAREQEFIRALLQSTRTSLRMRLKDYMRAYFNLNILNHLQGQENILCACVAGKDLFFVDPWGNVSPCNGSAEPWIMGSLREDSFDEIWSSPRAEEVRRRVSSCDRSCAFIGTARFDMLRHPIKPVRWIVESKMNLARGRDISFTP